MLLKDQPSFKEVAKVFIVGLALRSYVANDESDGQQRRTCFGHELSRRICLATNRQRVNNRHSLLKFKSAERVKDYDMGGKQLPIQQQRQLSPNAQKLASSSLNSKL